MVRAQLGAGTGEEEARAHLQARLTTLYKVMFWANAALLAFLWLMYRRYPKIEPHNDKWVFLIATIAIVVMGFIWRVLLVGPPRSFALLSGIDTFFSIGTGVVFGAAALLAYEFRPSAYTCLTYQCFALLTRALLVPSTGRRTAILTLASYVPMSVSAVTLSLLIPNYPPELPAFATLAGYVVILIVTTILTSAGSSIIYGLRREVDAAVQLGQYKTGRLIGKGGLGEVYLAHHVMLRRPTAIKVLRPDRVGPDDLARFVREVHVTSQLTHPNTVAVFDYGPTLDGGSFYYAMEYLGGGLNLEQLVERDGPLPAARVVAILVQVCGALQEAHEIGLVHRDITPSNIMLCERGGLPDVVKVLDFGLVQGFRAEIGTTQQITYGTPHYMAPEAITEPKIGPTGDLYALGCVAYFLVTGKPVFDGKTQLDILMKHASDAPVPPSRATVTPVPAELEAVILRCLAKHPADRFPTAAALAEALSALAFTDWNEELARAWWRDHANSDDASEASRSDIITVDIEHREGLAS
jgi:serine/threonine-protein kinase